MILANVLMFWNVYETDWICYLTSVVADICHYILISYWPNESVMIKTDDINNSQFQLQSNYFVSFCDLQIWSQQTCASVLWREEHVVVQRGGMHTTPRPRGAIHFSTAAVGETRTTLFSGGIALRSASKASKVLYDCFYIIIIHNNVW